MQQQIVQNIGWYGVIAILLAYALLTFRVLVPENTLYLLLNLTGAAAIAYEAWSKRDKQPMVLNIVWALVAVIGLIRLWIH